MDAAAVLNRANQLNPMHVAYYLARGLSQTEAVQAIASYAANGLGVAAVATASAGVVGTVISGAVTAYSVYSAGVLALSLYRRFRRT